MSNTRMYSPRRIAAISQRLAVRYDATDAETRRAGEQWYVEAKQTCQTIATSSGHTLPEIMFAGAALSPLKSWDQNVTILRDLAYSSTYRNPGTFSHQARVAWRCLQGETEALSGFKVKPFTAAILGDPDAVAIDTWIMRACGHTVNWCSAAQYCALIAAVTGGADRCSIEPRTFQAVIWCEIRGKRSTV